LRRANDDENCISILSNLVSRFTTFDAVSDIFETEVSSNFCPVKIGSNVTDCVGVVATVGEVDGVLSFFFFKTLLTALLNVDIESESLKKRKEAPSFFGISKNIELFPSLKSVEDERRPAELFVKS
jgi:hypothetical protein